MRPQLRLSSLHMHMYLSYLKFQCTINNRKGKGYHGPSPMLKGTTNVVVGPWYIFAS